MSAARSYGRDACCELDRVVPVVEEHVRLHCSRQLDGILLRVALAHRKKELRHGDAGGGSVQRYAWGVDLAAVGQYVTHPPLLRNHTHGLHASVTARAPRRGRGWRHSHGMPLSRRLAARTFRSSMLTVMCSTLSCIAPFSDGSRLCCHPS